jgi:cell wall-associated NlpC family hydrolase
VRPFRLALVLALAAALVLPAEGLAASWAKPQIKTAVDSGLMGPSVAAFKPNAPLTRRALARIVAGITKKPQVVTNPDQPVTMAGLDRALVAALGLRPAARHVNQVLRDAKLSPPPRAGWEVVARMLQLRTNHPASQDALERLPSDPATRAEAAWSVARVLQLDTWDLQGVSDSASSFALPPLTPWKQRVLTTAVRFVGYPYVWGGMSERRQTLFGVTSRGGFDCSGFVWRVFKLQRYSGAPRLGSTIRGRTTYDMSGEIRRTARIPRKSLRPADVLFFGDRGPKSSPREVGHAGIYLGTGWFIHSSGQGVTIVPFDGWYADSFAWGRRVLREAGLN